MPDNVMLDFKISPTGFELENDLIYARGEKGEKGDTGPQGPQGPQGPKGDTGDASLTILKYGISTWSDFINAYNANNVVYCRASSNSNPASGAQTRLAFMAYVNQETDPTNVEFQYYRSVSTHSATQQGDQVFVYKLDKTQGWSVTTREACIKIAAGNGLSQSFASNTLSIGLPAVTSSDNGKVLGVANGQWALITPSVII